MGCVGCKATSTRFCTDSFDARGDKDGGHVFPLTTRLSAAFTQGVRSAVAAGGKEPCIVVLDTEGGTTAKQVTALFHRSKRRRQIFNRLCLHDKHGMGHGGDAREHPHKVLRSLIDKVPRGAFVIAHNSSHDARVLSNTLCGDGNPLGGEETTPLNVNQLRKLQQDAAERLTLLDSVTMFRWALKGPGGQSFSCSITNLVEAFGLGAMFSSMHCNKAAKVAVVKKRVPLLKQHDALADVYVLWMLLAFLADWVWLFPDLTLEEARGKLFPRRKRWIHCCFGGHHRHSWIHTASKGIPLATRRRRRVIAFLCEHGRRATIAVDKVALENVDVMCWVAPTTYTRLVGAAKGAGPFTQGTLDKAYFEFFR